MKPLNPVTLFLLLLFFATTGVKSQSSVDTKYEVNEHTKRQIIPIVVDNKAELPEAEEDPVNFALSISYPEDETFDATFYSYMSTSKYLKGRQPRTRFFDWEMNEHVELFNWIEFTLNEELESKGYYEASIERLINDHFVVEGELKECHFSSIGINKGMLEAEIMWTLKNSYGDKLDSLAFESLSNWYILDNMFSKDNHVIMECFRNGFIEYIQSDSVNKVILDYKEGLKEDDNYAELSIAKPTHSSDVKTAVKSSATIICDNSHGSGILLSNDGLVITNYHVVANTDTIKVVFDDEIERIGHVERINRKTDLAIIKLDSTISNVPPLVIGLDEPIDLGMDVYAIGSPEEIDFGQTISKGILSAKRKVKDQLFLQTDVSINSGNSGGALINAEGKLIGIVNARYTGFGVSGIGFAIPVTEAFQALKITIQE